MKSILLSVLAALFFLPHIACAEDKAGLTDRVKKEYGEQCTVLEECGNILHVDCGSAFDGPAYYLNKDTLEKIMVCGGACMAPRDALNGINCTQCPPAAWTCKGN